MRTPYIALVSIGMLVCTAAGQPLEFSDDLLTVTTYDSASLMAPCYGGPPTKYTLFEAIGGDIFNERALSGGSQFIFTNRNPLMAPGLGRKEIAVIGWVGFTIGCPGEPAPFRSTYAFTSEKVCVYGGMTYSPWQMHFPPPNGWGINGADGVPGVAGVDDDLDGTTDEIDESHMARPTTVNSGYGNRDGTGFEAGVDAAPGVAGVDDDGNGIVDDYGEIGTPLTDDGDDVNRPIHWMMMDGDIGTSQSVLLVMDAGSSADIFSLRELRDLASISIENSNEIPYNFYNANTQYNWVYCSSGTCYGAALWVGRDLTNPVETVGPAVNTYHTGPNANLVGPGFDSYQGPSNQSPRQFIRQTKVLGNLNFSNTFWVISGDTSTYYPSASADLDSDRDVDGTDFLTFSNCFNGALKPASPLCVNLHADLDGDDDVDGTDFLTFSNCFNGALKKPTAQCFPPDLTACP